MATAEGLKRVFETPEELIDYISTHRATPRALVRESHLVLAAFVAGWSLCGMPASVFDGRAWRSLNDLDADKLCEDARARIAAGKVPTDWIEQCMAQVRRN